MYENSILNCGVSNQNRQKLSHQLNQRRHKGKSGERERERERQHPPHDSKGHVQTNKFQMVSFQTTLYPSPSTTTATHSTKKNYSDKNKFHKLKISLKFSKQ